MRQTELAQVCYTLFLYCSELFALELQHLSQFLLYLKADIPLTYFHLSGLESDIY